MLGKSLLYEVDSLWEVLQHILLVVVLNLAEQAIPDAVRVFELLRHVGHHGEDMRDSALIEQVGTFCRHEGGHVDPGVYLVDCVLSLSGIEKRGCFSESVLFARLYHFEI